ncbi:hypothetical protein [Companilactobacillus nantensis]|uniref:Uncharacterized protein n=1 Tax=Companilactobacillus nantensis DSM 16982 TaxID=1423774 RepID=A0A0R1WJM3_9LACO|nr:hypothetical protein [Companilactobacillus nantensis]KRM18064.1 hypothetical protein FD31_GL001866 [Companilactobacillus nantensis DSM 16982]GEO63705.1 hypothetical protein LNA01_08880 [Companilactobacillus nantensis]
MLIEKIEDLKKVTANKQTEFEVANAAFDFCYQIHMEQVVGSSADWSIAVTHGWMALVTGFNHKIHRAFMSQEKRDLQDLKHVIFTKYIIKKTDDNTKYKLVLRVK